MTILELYEVHYLDYSAFTGGDKYEWASSEVFDLTTYDGALDKLFVEKIIEVLKVIFERKTYEYIKDENNYITYILVCNILTRFNWINWGTSIRGAWFDFYHLNSKTRPIIDRNLELYGCSEIPASEENLKTLIEFIEAEEK